MIVKNRKFLKIFAILFIVGLCAGLVVFIKIWYAPHRDVRTETGIKITAEDIAAAYTTNEANANTLYLDKAIEVSGTISEISKNQEGKTVIALQTADPMAGVRCTLAQDAILSTGSKITIIGQCSGFLMDVTLIDCYVKK